MTETYMTSTETDCKHTRKHLEGDINPSSHKIEYYIQCDDCESSWSSVWWT